jgi:hypothetical protein
MYPKPLAIPVDERDDGDCGVCGWVVFSDRFAANQLDYLGTVPSSCLSGLDGLQSKNALGRDKKYGFEQGAYS